MKYIYLLFSLLFLLGGMLNAQDTEQHEEKIVRKSDVSLLEYDESDFSKVTVLRDRFSQYNWQKPTVELEMLILKATKDFDYEVFFLNRRKASGRVKILGWSDTSKMKDGTFKKEYLKLEDKYKKYYYKREFYKELSNIRLLAISKLTVLSLEPKDDKVFLELLRPLELEILNSQERSSYTYDKMYFGMHCKYVKDLQKKYEKKIDINEYPEVINGEILDYIKFYKEDKDRFFNFNIDALKEKMAKKDMNCTWDEIFEVLSFVTEYRNEEDYLFNNYFAQAALYDLQYTVLNSIAKKDFAEKSNELKQLLGERFYLEFFIEKLNIHKIDDFGFNLVRKKLQGED